MTARPVAVVGGYGGAGRVAARLLREWGTGPLRVGGRDSRAAAALARELGGGAVAAAVDAADPASLRRFCDGCAVVLNCAGPSHDLRDAVAAAAVAAGADYVDPAGDDDLFECVERLVRGGPRTAVLSAGMLPGLTELLPRYLARHRPVGGGVLVAHVGGRDRFTPAGAADYLLAGDDFGRPAAAIVGGVAIAGALTAQDDVRPPYFPEPVAAQPYLARETERLAGALDLAGVRWYHVTAGRHLAAALRPAAALAPSDRRRAVAGLRAAAELDTFGRETYQIILLELTTAAGEQAAAVLRGTGADALTGTFAALATEAVAAGVVPAGAHRAAEVLDPDEIVERLRREAAVTALDLVAGPLAQDVEGTV